MGCFRLKMGCFGGNIWLNGMCFDPGGGLFSITASSWMDHHPIAAFGCFALVAESSCFHTGPTVERAQGGRTLLSPEAYPAIP